MRVSAIILAGGQGTRMEGLNKGLVKLHDKPLIQHVIERLTPQVDEVLINANQDIEQYQAFNLPVFQDETPDFIGPLAGFDIGLKHCAHEYLLTVPCDSPLIPDHLVSRLQSALLDHDANIAIATSAGNVHPVFSFMKTSVHGSLKQFINQNERKVSKWQKSLTMIEVDFTDCHDAFVNLNTLEALEALSLNLSHE